MSGAAGTCRSASAVETTLMGWGLAGSRTMLVAAWLGPEEVRASSVTTRRTESTSWAELMRLAISASFWSWAARLLVASSACFSRGRVPEHLAEAAEAAGVVVEGGHHAVGEEAGAVLPHVPPPVLGPTRSRPPSHLLLRSPVGPVLRREEEVRLPPDGLRGGVAGDPLGAALPLEDGAGGVGDDDGVVPGVVDQEVQPLGLRPHLVLGPLAVGQVDALGEDAGDGPVRVAEGLVDEVHEPLLGRAAGPPPEQDRHVRAGECLAGPVDPVEQLEEALALDLGQGLAGRLAEDVPVAR